jgi:hypothetical protein
MTTPTTKASAMQAAFESQCVCCSEYDSERGYQLCDSERCYQAFCEAYVQETWINAPAEVIELQPFDFGDYEF